MPLMVRNGVSMINDYKMKVRNNMRKYLLYIVLLLQITSCVMIQKKRPSIEDCMPRETDVPGWELMKSPVLSDEELSLKKNDYNSSGIVEGKSALYRAYYDRRELRVEVLRFDSVKNAFGRFSIDRGFGPGIRNITEDSYFSDNGFFTRIGDYCISIRCKNINDGSKKDLEQFMAVIDDKLHSFTSSEGLPEYITLFSKNYTRYNLAYYRSGFTDIKSLGDVWVSEKMILDKRRLVFFCKKDSSADSAELFHKLSFNEGFTVSLFNKNLISFKKVADDKFIFISTHKEWIFGLLNADNIKDGNRIIELLHGSIKEMAR